MIGLSKNLTYCFDTHRSSDSAYQFDCFLCVDCVDGDYNVECEGIYESVDSYRCNNSTYLQLGARTNDSHFSVNCTACTNVFGCVNLTNKSFCLFNRQLTEQQYKEEVKKYQAMPPEKILKMVDDLVNRFPRTQSAGEFNVNSPYGNYINHCKNCYMCFDAANSEDCIYGYDTFYCKNCLDTTYAGQYVEESYQMVDAQHCNNCNYVVESNNCQDSSFIFNSKGLKNCFGCVGLQYKQFCVLNRQLTEQQYKEVTSQLKQELAAANLGWSNLVN